MVPDVSVIRLRMPSTSFDADDQAQKNAEASTPEDEESDDADFDQL